MIGLGSDKNRVISTPPPRWSEPKWEKANQEAPQIKNFWIRSPGWHIGFFFIWYWMEGLKSSLDIFRNKGFTYILDALQLDCLKLNYPSWLGLAASYFHNHLTVVKRHGKREVKIESCCHTMWVLKSVTPNKVSLLLSSILCGFIACGRKQSLTLLRVFFDSNLKGVEDEDEVADVTIIGSWTTFCQKFSHTVMITWQEVLKSWETKAKSWIQQLGNGHSFTLPSGS